MLGKRIGWLRLLGLRVKDAGVGFGQRGCGWLGVGLGIVYGLESGLHETLA